MSKKTKYYTVWSGREMGVFSSWEDCKKQVEGFEGAQYKSFPTEEEAKEAFLYDYWEFVRKQTKPGVRKKGETGLNVIGPRPNLDTLSVDAACSGNPGKMEYRGVLTRTGEEIFRAGPFECGTNNIGEFLAIVHGLALLKKQGKEKYPIYSDSKTGMSWVRQKKCKTKLEENERNRPLFELVRRAEEWLKKHTVRTPILKWDTEQWGEIPADFGRK